MTAVARRSRPRRDPSALVAVTSMRTVAPTSAVGERVGRAVAPGDVREARARVALPLVGVGVPDARPGAVAVGQRLVRCAVPVIVGATVLTGAAAATGPVASEWRRRRAVGLVAVTFDARSRLRRPSASM